MIIPSNRNNLNREEQNHAFGGALMKKFLHQQFDSPYFENEQERFKNQQYSEQEKQNRNLQQEINKQKLEKRRVQQLEYNANFYPKNESLPRIRSSNTFQSGIPIDPINQQVNLSQNGQNFKNQQKDHCIRDLTRCQNLQYKQQPYNILTGVFRSMVDVPNQQQQAFTERLQQNPQVNKPPKNMLFY